MRLVFIRYLAYFFLLMSPWHGSSYVNSPLVLLANTGHIRFYLHNKISSEMGVQTFKLRQY